MDQIATALLHPHLQQITHQFFLCLDEFRYDDLVSLMTPDAQWHRQGKVLRGHAQALTALGERPRTQRIRHVITNFLVTRADDSGADAVAYMTAYKHDDGTDAPPPRTIPGPFRMLLVKTRFTRQAGRWLIAEQSATAEFEFKPATMRGTP